MILEVFLIIMAILIGLVIYFRNDISQWFNRNWKKIIVVLAGVTLAGTGAMFLPEPPTPRGALIYISANDGDDDGAGTIGDPYHTFDKALSVASWGDTIYARGGTYMLSNESYPSHGIYLDVSGIMITNYNDENVILNGSGVTLGGSYAAMSIGLGGTSANNITINGINITAIYGTAKNTYCYGIGIFPNVDTTCGCNINITNCTFNNMTHAALMVYSNAYYVHDIEVSNCTFNNIQTWESMGEGVTVNKCDNFLFENNVMTDCMKTYVDLATNSSNCTIRYNHFYNNGTISTGSTVPCIYFAGGQATYPDWSYSKDHKIYNNYIQMTDGVGIAGNIEKTGGYVDNVSVYNNIIKIISDTTARYGVSMFNDGSVISNPLRNISYTFNTMHLTGSAGAAFAGGLWLYYTDDSEYDNCVFANNIIYSSVSGTNTDRLIQAEDITYPPENITLCNNCYNHTSKSAVAYWNGVKGTYFGDDAVNASPDFISESNLNLSGASPCINTGNSSYTISFDYADASRPVGSGYDIGAYEYSSTIIYISANDGSDSGTGTISDPYHTFSKAISVASSGVTIYARGGVYNLSNESIPAHGIHLDVCNATVSNYNDEVVVFDCSMQTLGGGRGAIGIGYDNYVAHNVTVYGINVTGVYGGYGVIVYSTDNVHSSHNITFSHCTFNNMTGYGFSTYYYETHQIQDITVDNCTFNDICSDYGSQECMCFISTNRGLFENNVITNCRKIYIDFGSNSSNCIARYNRMWSNGTVATDHVHSFIKVDGGQRYLPDTCYSNDHLIYNNYMKGIDIAGFSIDGGEHSGGSIDNITCYNNIAKITSDTLNVYGASIWNAQSVQNVSNITFTFNTIYCDGSVSGSYVSPGLYFYDAYDYEYDNITVANNIFVSNTTGPVASRIIQADKLDYPAGNVTLTNNLYHHTSQSAVAYWNGDVGSYFGANYVNASPEFVSSSDLHLTADSPAIDAGSSLYTVEYDYDGVARPWWNLYDIGAYEYVSNGIISGRVLYNNTLSAVENLGVTVNYEPAEIYGTTFLCRNATYGEAVVNVSINNELFDEKTVSISSPAVHSVDFLMPHTVGSTPSVSVTATKIHIDWGDGLTLNLTKTPTPTITGFGEVRINNTVVRSSTVSGVPLVYKISGGAHVPCSHGATTYQGYDTYGETVVVHSNYTISDGNVTVDWIFTPWWVNNSDNHYRGIGYRYYIESPVNLSEVKYSNHWELGGNISEKRFYARRVNNFIEKDFTYSNSHSSSTPLGILVQSQPPEYQYNSTAGALASFIYPPSHTTDLLTKPTNNGLLWINDTYWPGNLSYCNTSFRVVLYNDTGGLDNYTYLYDNITRNYRSFYGIEDTYVTPTAFISQQMNYSTAGSGNPLAFVWCADNNFTTMENMSFERIHILSIWNSSGRMGDNNNRLATYEVEILDEDVENVTYFADKAADHGLNITVWLGICYHDDSPLNVTYDWAVREVDGDYPGAAAGDTFTMSFRSGYLNYVLDRLEDIQDEYGFYGIGHDSFTYSTSIDYTERGIPIKESIDQAMQYLSAAQELGFEPYTESYSPFSEVVLANIDFSDFEGKEYLAYKFQAVAKDTADYGPIAFDYYKWVANKALVSINLWYTNDSNNATINQTNQDYNNVSRYMDKRHVIFNETGEQCNGTLWYDNESSTQVLFAFASFTHSVASNINNVMNITTGVGVELVDGQFTTAVNNTYVLRARPWAMEDFDDDTTGVIANNTRPVEPDDWYNESYVCRNWEAYSSEDNISITGDQYNSAPHSVVFETITLPATGQPALQFELLPEDAVTFDYLSFYYRSFYKIGNDGIKLRARNSTAEIFQMFLGDGFVADESENEIRIMDFSGVFQYAVTDLPIYTWYHINISFNWSTSYVEVFIDDVSYGWFQMRHDVSDDPGATSIQISLVDGYRSCQHVDDIIVGELVPEVPTSYNATVRATGTDYFTWMGDNISASEVAQIIPGFNEATEHISIWNMSETGYPLWDVYYGDDSGTDWEVHTFDIIRIYLTDSGTIDVEMEVNEDIDYDAGRNITCTYSSDNKGYNYVGWSNTTSKTLSTINSSCSNLSSGDCLAWWDNSSYSWVFWFSYYNNPSQWDKTVSLQDILIVNVRDTRYIEV